MENNIKVDEDVLQDFRETIDLLDKKRHELGMLVVNISTAEGQLKNLTTLKEGLLSDIYLLTSKVERLKAEFEVKYGSGVLDISTGLFQTK